jgi:putrescine aminotransferase
MPAGAYITTDEIGKKHTAVWIKALLHTSTFGGNTWAAAAGIAALEVILERTSGEARETGEYLINGLRRLKKNTR